LNTQEVVDHILKTHCGVKTPPLLITTEARLVEDLGLDSVGLLTLVVEVENHYQMQLEESPEQPPRTVGQLIELIEQRRLATS